MMFFDDADVYLLNTYLSAKKNINGLEVTRDSTQLGIGEAIPLMPSLMVLPPSATRVMSPKIVLGPSCIKADDYGYSLSAGVKTLLLAGSVIESFNIRSQPSLFTFFDFISHQAW